MFGKIERLPWSRAEEAVLQNIAYRRKFVTNALLRARACEYDGQL